jgi:dTDP-4-dehydrorhamnose reductase
MQIMLTGGEGRLGAALAVELAGGGHAVTALGRADVDITNREQVAAAVNTLHPDVIVNCSAYNAVDDAERDVTRAFAVNAEGPGILAAEARRVAALFIHFSSDFVFDGAAVEPYSEHAPTRPLSVYGASKLAGELEAARAVRHYVLRLASNFGGSATGGRVATIDRIVDNLLEGRTVRAFADRTVSPSYVVDVALATRAIIECRVPYGTYHCVNSGYTTWYGLAETIARKAGIDADIRAVASSDVVTPAVRPRFCALSNRKLRSTGIAMPTWESAIDRHLAIRGIGVPAAVQRQAWQIHS